MHAMLRMTWHHLCVALFQQLVRPSFLYWAPESPCFAACGHRRVQVIRGAFDAFGSHAVRPVSRARAHLHNWAELLQDPQRSLVRNRPGILVAHFCSLLRYQLPQLLPALLRTGSI
jgi:hypothetical protein